MSKCIINTKQFQIHYIITTCIAADQFGIVDKDSLKDMNFFCSSSQAADKGAAASALPERAAHVTLQNQQAGPFSMADHIEKTLTKQQLNLTEHRTFPAEFRAVHIVYVSLPLVSAAVFSPISCYNSTQS